MITPDRVTALKPNEIFVFGSNMAGIHGAGAARLAYERFKAEWGKAEGHSGQAYAIPTKNETISETLSLAAIRKSVKRYLKYAENNPDLVFLTTEIGCGLAGLTAEQVAPMFGPANQIPPNVALPRRFLDLLIPESECKNG